MGNATKREMDGAGSLGNSRPLKALWLAPVGGGWAVSKEHGDAGKSRALPLAV